MILKNNIEIIISRLLVELLIEKLLKYIIIIYEERIKEQSKFFTNITQE